MPLKHCRCALHHPRDATDAFLLQDASLDETGRWEDVLQDTYDDDWSFWSWCRENPTWSFDADEFTKKVSAYHVQILSGGAEYVKSWKDLKSVSGLPGIFGNLEPVPRPQRQLLRKIVSQVPIASNETATALYSQNQMTFSFGEVDQLLLCGRWGHNQTEDQV